MTRLTTMSLQPKPIKGRKKSPPRPTTGKKSSLPQEDLRTQVDRLLEYAQFWLWVDDPKPAEEPLRGTVEECAITSRSTVDRLLEYAQFWLWVDDPKPAEEPLRGTVEECAITSRSKSTNPPRMAIMSRPV